jgi:hypothetical protein
MTTGPWKDEQRRPGPWPQGRRAPLAIAAAVVAAILVRVTLGHVHSRALLGGLVIVIALGGFYTALTLNQTRLEKQRYTRGPGWLIGVTISKLPLGVARMVWLAISLGILALGIAEIAGA